MLNFNPEPFGGASKRPGTRWAWTVKDETKNTVIIPFEQGGELHFIECGENYFRVMEKNGDDWQVQQDEGYTMPYIDASLGEELFYHHEERLAKQILMYISYDEFPLRAGMGPYRITSTGSIPTNLSGSTDYWMYVVKYEQTFSNGLQPGDMGVKVGYAKPEIGIGFATSRADAVKISLGIPPLTGGSLDVLLHDQAVLVGINDQGTGEHTLTLTSGDVEHYTAWSDADIPNLVYHQDGKKLYISDGVNPMIIINKMTYPGCDNMNATPGDNWAQAKWTVEDHDLRYGPFKYHQAAGAYGVGEFDLEREVVGSDVWMNIKDQPARDRSMIGHFPVPDSGVTVDDLYPSDVVMVRNTAASGTSDDFMLMFPVLSVATATESYVRFQVFKDYYLNGISATTSPSTGASWGLVFFNSSPTAIGVYQQRLLLAGGNKPNAVFGSSLEDHRFFLPGDFIDGKVSGYTAIDIDFAADEDSAILGYAELRDLLVFSSSGVFIVRAADTQAGLSVGNTTTKRINRLGGSTIQPVAIDNSAVYVSASGRKVYDVRYDYDAKDYITRDLLLASEHILKGGVTSLTYQHEPHATIWTTRTDGTLVSILNRRGSETVGVARHTLGGSSVSADNLVTAQDGLDRKVYMIVNRTVNGTPRQFIEVLDPPQESSFDKADAYHLDCGFTYDGVSTTNPVFPGGSANVLVGETVDVVADGIYIGTKVIDTGGDFTVALATAASKVHIGYTYTSDLEPTPPTFALGSGTADGATKRISGTTVRFLETIGGEVGSKTATLVDVEYETGDELYTGDKAVDFSSDSSGSPSILIRQSKPLPMTVLAVINEVDTSDREFKE